MMDISIKDGGIVERVNDSAEIIDTGGCLTLRGGVDPDCHVSGTTVNFGGA
jgi:formylmethanofuran dehydrogenase subunit A